MKTRFDQLRIAGAAGLGLFFIPFAGQMQAVSASRVRDIRMVVRSISFSGQIVRAYVIR
jgi:hypothetical protein